MQEEKKRGGVRPGSGRNATGRNVVLSARITQNALDRLNQLTNNKSEYLDKLIKQQPLE